MLRHLVSEHEKQDFSEIKFGMKILKFTRSSFERQILEAVIIEQEAKKNHILNSRTEYNRSSLPRLTTKLGDSEYQNWQKELAQDKKKNMIIDDKIRALRKARNKARLLPSKEAPPAKKRRTEEGISIRQVWGRPDVKKSEKMTRNDYERNEKKTNLQDIETKQKVIKRDKKSGIEISSEGIVSAPEKNWEKYEKLDWEKEIERHRINLEKKAEEENFKEKLEESEEPSWELLRYCTNYLEDNSEFWAKRKRINEQEMKRQERLAIARQKQVKTQLSLIEKKIHEGMTLLPREKREKMEREEMKSRTLKLQEVKSSMWKLRNKDKKIEKKSDLQEKLDGMTGKMEKIKKLLQETREQDEKTKQEEIVRKEMEEKTRKVKLQRQEQQRRYLAEKERLLKKKKTLEERYQMLRWVTSYIDKNKSDWEKRKIVRIEKEKKVLEEWDRLARQEKMDEIMLIREAERAERQETQGFKDKKTEKIEKATRKSVSWKVWRENPDPDVDKEPEIADSPKTQPNLVKNEQSEQIQPLKIKIQQSKLAPNRNTTRLKPKNTIAKYKHQQNTAWKPNKKIQLKVNTRKTTTQPKLVPEEPEKRTQLKPTQISHTPTIETKPEQIGKVFSIFQKSTSREKPAPLPTAKKKIPSTKEKPKIDPKLAPSIKLFFLQKQTVPSESTPDARARPVNSDDPDVPDIPVYTCTQPQNGGK